MYQRAEQSLEVPEVLEAQVDLVDLAEVIHLLMVKLLIQMLDMFQKVKLLQNVVIYLSRHL